MVNYNAMNAMAVNHQTVRPRPHEHRCAGGRNLRILLGLLCLFVGGVVLLDRAGIGRQHLPEQLWPFVLITMGFVHLFDAPADAWQRRSRRPGIWLVIIGCWGAVNEFHLFGFDDETSWPLLVIAAGTIMIWRALDPPIAPHADAGE